MKGSQERKEEARLKRSKRDRKPIPGSVNAPLPNGGDSVSDLKPAAYNPRTISAEKLEMLKEAMIEFGDLSGVILNRTTGQLVGGHQRVKHFDPAWTIIKEDHQDSTGTVATGHIDTPYGRWTYREVEWSLEKERAANIAANKHGGEWDEDLLASLMQQLYDDGADMNLTGFTDEEIKDLLGITEDRELGEEDPDGEPVPDPIVRRGDLWILGDHRLLCGDSTSQEDLARLMAGEMADCIVTDPPYNVAYESKAGKIENDNLSTEAFKEFLSKVFTTMHDALKPGGCFYVYHAEGNQLGDIFRSAIGNIQGLLLKQCLIWVKNQMVLSRQDYSWKHEPILYGWKAGAAHYYDGDFTRSTVIDDDIDISKLSKKEMQTLISELRNKVPSSVIRVDKPQKSDIHPTTKPVRLFEKNILASTRPKEIVLDLFSGSGTTIVTCRKTGRRGRGMELSENYLEASLLRYQEYCGEEAYLEMPDGTLVPFKEVKKQRKKEKA